MEIEVKPQFMTVTELNRLVREEIENNPYLTNIWVKGEIFNLTYHSSGHIYFTLKDEGAAVSAVFFRNYNKNMKFRLEEGMSVLVLGGLTVFEKRGSYQLNAMSVRPEGAGELQKRIEQLRKKLMDEGIFDPAHKRPLPFLPKRLGVVTSPTGAALHDIIKVALRRFPNIEIVVAPAKVQGDDAPGSIARAIRELGRPQWGVDVIIAGRGGGSFEDLMPFNEEVVVRACYNSTVPIISAVGHQVDHPLCDDASDAFAPTPSAAAELAVPVRTDLEDEIKYLVNRMNMALSSGVEKLAARLAGTASRKVFRDPYEIINMREMLLSDTESRMAMHMQGVITSRKERLLHIPDITMLEKRILMEKRHLFSMQLQAIEKLSPMNIMARGYAVVTGAGKKIIKSVEKIKAGDKVEIRFYDGLASAEITSAAKEK
ncbi:MAG TPA: exodeoxyribonuclease VII large subunit [Spirochaetota bacterium]|nr:exodeoxyribonuclease VII large subunit [Spirochaetota bacterium]HQO40216.1 exodeoxyribonuclease VII large subunit [Spirochaetota bacterium]